MSASTTTTLQKRLAATVAVLLIAAAALLIAGILLERQAEAGSPPSDVATTEHQDGHLDESAEAPPAGENEAADPLAGIGVESPWIIALGTVTTIALAVAVWRRPSRAVIAAVVAFTALALVFDVLEMKHQAAEGRTALILLAALIVAIRVSTIAACGYLYRANAVKARDSLKAWPTAQHG